MFNYHKKIGVVVWVIIVLTIYLYPTISYCFDFPTEPIQQVLSHDGQSYKQVKKLNLVSANLSGKTLRDIHFIDCNLRNANFTGATLIGIEFERTNLTQADFTGATIVSCKFTGSGSGVS